MDNLGDRVRSAKPAPDPVLEDIGRDIRLLRQEKGWTQRDLAQKMQVKQQVISHLERGESNVSVGYLRRVAEFLGVEVRISFRKVI